MNGLRIALVGLLLAVTGCVSVPTYTTPKPRAFDFKRDAPDYSNLMTWTYRTDPRTGAITTHPNPNPPDFTKRCYTVSQMTRQFFQHAQFDPRLPKTDAATYATAIEAVVARTPAQTQRHGKVRIPGYANLRHFSRDHEPRLKAAGGGPWSSYLQWSNWRMIFPFSREHQIETAQRLLETVKQNRLPLLHLIRFDSFPATEIDHFVMLVSAQETPELIRFRVFEPNNATRPGTLIFDRGQRTFVFPRNEYFVGGALDVYEVDRSELF